MNQRQKKEILELAEIYGNREVLRGLEIMELERHFKESKERITKQLLNLEA